MPKNEEIESELYDDSVESSYTEDSDDNLDPTEEAFLKGYEEADRIEETDNWEFDDDD